MIKLDFDPLVNLIDRGVGQMRLVRTDPMDSIVDFDTSFLKPIYNSKDKAKVIYASVLKAALLQRRVCFLLSRRELDQLVKADEDNRYKSVNERDYSQFLVHIVGNDILQYIFEPSDLAGIAALVAVHGEIIKALRQLESAEFYRKQVDKSKEIYQKKLKKLTELQEKRQQRANSRTERQVPPRKSQE